MTPQGYTARRWEHRDLSSHGPIPLATLLTTLLLLLWQSG